jgi:hypothetical protein
MKHWFHILSLAASLGGCGTHQEIATLPDPPGPITVIDWTPPSSPIALYDFDVSLDPKTRGFDKYTLNVSWKSEAAEGKGLTGWLLQDGRTIARGAAIYPLAEKGMIRYSMGPYSLAPGFRYVLEIRTDSPDEMEVLISKSPDEVREASRLVRAVEIDLRGGTL